MSEEAQDSGKEAQDNNMESQIKAAISSRASYIQHHCDSLTFAAVRRLLEEDLGLPTRALDSHKTFVKHLLQKCIESTSADTLPESQVDAGDNALSLTDGELPVNDSQAKKSEKPNSGGGETMEDSPVMGLLTLPKKIKTNTNGAEDTISKVVPSETTVKKAIWARASYLRENSHCVTLLAFRRLLEEDLGLEKQVLDPLKKFISKQVDEVLNSPESPQITASDKKQSVKKASHGKASSKTSKEKTPATSDDESDEVQEKEVKVRKKGAPKAKSQKSEPVKKRKRAEEDTKGAKRKQSKASNSRSEASGVEDSGNVSEDENSESSAEKPVKKKEVPKPSYGNKVENLRSIIRSCGLSIPPVIYKKAKQAPENKHEAFLIKELEEILVKEGLSTHPSEKEIKEVKKRKERARELEGIDMSNIVSSSRRRSAISFTPPPKPKIPDMSESESEESENDGEDEDDEEEGHEEVEDEEADEDQENGGDGSAGEESDAGDSGSD